MWYSKDAAPARNDNTADVMEALNQAEPLGSIDIINMTKVVTKTNQVFAFKLQCFGFSHWKMLTISSALRSGNEQCHVSCDIPGENFDSRRRGRGWRGRGYLVTSQILFYLSQTTSYCSQTLILPLASQIFPLTCPVFPLANSTFLCHRYLFYARVFFGNT